MAEIVAWILGITAVILSLVCKHAYYREERLERTIQGFQKTIASDAAIKVTKDERIEELTNLAQQHEARAATLAGNDVRLEDEITGLNRPPIYRLPVVGSTVTTN